MSHKPKVSVIIPVYNVDKYLERCLDSVYSQDFQNFEIIAVDDCSSDSSVDILYSYQARYSNIRIYTHQQNKGLMFARYTGYKNACGDYFIFLDSDDFLPHNALSTLFETIKLEGCDVVKTGYTVVDKNLTVISTYTPSPKVFSGREYYESILNEHVKHNLWGAIYSRRLFDNIQYVTYTNQTNSEDLILSLQLAKNIKHLRWLKESTYFYFENRESSSRKRFNDNNLLQYLRALEFIYAQINRDTNKELHIAYLIRKIGSLLFNNYDIYLIKSSMQVFCERYYAWNALISRFNFVQSINYYLLYNNKFYRAFLYSLRPIINKFRR